MAVKRWLLLLLVVKAALYQNMGNVNRLRDNTAYTLSLSVSPFPEYIITTTTLLLHTFHGLFSRTTWVSWYQKGKISLDLNEARDDRVWGWQWHQLDHMQTTCTSFQTDNHINTSSLHFYRLDALRDAQATVSKH